MKTKILQALRSTDGYVSGQELCEQFGVSRTAVWKVIQKLKQEGYQIQAVSNRGYHLLDSNDILNQEEINHLKKTSWIGKEAYYFEKTDSTNVQLKKLAEQGCAHGTLVVTDCQTSGKGRRGRDWSSEQRRGIYMSLLLRPEMETYQAPMLTLVTAMAVTEAIRKEYDLEVKIKWPNDIVYNGKKVCGILTEMSVEMDYINYVIIGIGINVTNEEFPEDLKYKATSLYKETEKKVNRIQLIETIWEKFEKYYEIFCQTYDLSNLQEEYNSLLANKYLRVKVLDPKNPFEGVALGIDSKGELIVDREGTEVTVASGEVSVRGIYGYI